jgi:hypothetical protein
MAFETGVYGIVGRMAIGAGCTFMVNTIFAAAAGVVKGCIPITGVVALRTVCAKHPGMYRRFGVTGNACGWKLAKIAAFMALRAVQPKVCTGQWESRKRMVECCRQPAVGCMACGTVPAELAVVFILRYVAGVAIGGSAPEDVINMASRTRHCGMFTCQFKGEQVVVHGC